MDIPIARRFCVIQFLLLLELGYMIWFACMQESKWILFKCIPLPKFNTSILFHISTIISCVPPIVQSCYGVIQPNTIYYKSGLFRGQHIEFNSEGAPDWPYNSTDLIAIHLNSFATICRISRMESVIRKGWGLPWPRGWDDPRDSVHSEDFCRSVSSCRPRTGVCCGKRWSDCDCCGRKEEGAGKDLELLADTNDPYSASFGIPTTPSSLHPDSTVNSTPLHQSQLTLKTRKRMLRRVAAISLSLALVTALMSFQITFNSIVVATEVYILDKSTYIPLADKIAGIANPLIQIARDRLIYGVEQVEHVLLIVPIGYPYDYYPVMMNDGVNPAQPGLQKNRPNPANWQPWLNPEIFYISSTTPVTKFGFPFENAVISIRPNKFWTTNPVNMCTVDPLGALTLCAVVVVESEAQLQRAWLGLSVVALFCVIWVTSVYSFSSPLLAFVVYPLEKVSRLFYLLRFDPLQTLRVNWLASEVTGCTWCWGSEQLSGLETTSLIRALLRLAELLAVALGPSGTSFYKAVVSTNTTTEAGRTGRRGGKNTIKGGLNLKGVRVSGIFMFCDIRNFTDTTELLQGDVFRWINGIAGVVHGICSEHNGSAVKHVGDAFLMVWTFSPGPTPAAAEVLSRQNKWECTQQAEKCLLAVARITIALADEHRFIVPVSSSSRDLLIGSGLNRVRVGFGLHAGNAIQGAIGSHLKVDVTFISKSSEVAEHLEGKTKEYGVPVLMSGKFHGLLGKQTGGKCRQVDFGQQGSGGNGELYTFDIDEDTALNGNWGRSHGAPAAAQGTTMSGQYDPRVWVQEAVLRDARRKFTQGGFLGKWREKFEAYRGAETEEELRETEEGMQEFMEEYGDGVADRLRLKCRERRERIRDRRGEG
ncbi:hypothetical protein TrCOL_g8548 [Triparma columacea]|uniref:Guanylate cyclase domain-containing protein n=1 Tax=Triparma columacea TaxID=722753 RepID=A0A9W7L7F6_9STRA|nr:hypothetical protein TrCOL_g8548 [Triparma columacea]